MDTKLTVRVRRHLLENAKRYARDNHTTLTELISAYLQHIPKGADIPHDAPIVKRLTGSLSPNITIGEYKKHLDDKYGGE